MEVNKPKKTSEILADISARQNSGQSTVVDLLLSKRISPEQHQAIAGTLYFIKQGCYIKCLPSDIKGAAT